MARSRRSRRTQKAYPWGSGKLPVFHLHLSFILPSRGQVEQLSGFIWVINGQADGCDVLQRLCNKTGKNNIKKSECRRRTTKAEKDRENEREGERENKTIKQNIVGNLSNRFTHLWPSELSKNTHTQTHNYYISNMPLLNPFKNFFGTKTLFG